MREKRIPVYGTKYDGTVGVIGDLILSASTKIQPFDVERVAMNDGSAIVRISPKENPHA